MNPNKISNNKIVFPKELFEILKPIGFKSESINVNSDFIESIYFNEDKRTTVVKYKDRSITKVKASEDTEFNEYQGFVSALAIKMLGSNSNVKRILETKNKTKYKRKNVSGDFEVGDKVLLNGKEYYVTNINFDTSYKFHVSRHKEDVGLSDIDIISKYHTDFGVDRDFANAKDLTLIRKGGH